MDHDQYDFFDRDHRSDNGTQLTATKHSFRQFVGAFLDNIKRGGIIRRYFKGWMTSLSIKCHAKAKTLEIGENLFPRLRDSLMGVGGESRNLRT